jgi:outer membrane protein TolC
MLSRRNTHSSRLAPCLGSAILSLLTGCTVGPNFRAPSAPDTPRFTEKPLASQTISAAIPAGAAQRLVNGRDIQGDWWTLFHSPQLNALVSRALTANPDLAAAQATLREARKNTRAEQGGQYPQVSTTL